MTPLGSGSADMATASLSPMAAGAPAPAPAEWSALAAQRGCGVEQLLRRGGIRQGRLRARAPDNARLRSFWCSRCGSRGQMRLIMRSPPRGHAGGEPAHQRLPIVGRRRPWTRTAGLRRPPRSSGDDDLVGDLGGLAGADIAYQRVLPISSGGFTRSKALSVPPTMIVNEAALATSPPDTGAST